MHKEKSAGEELPEQKPAGGETPEQKRSVGKLPGGKQLKRGKKTAILLGAVLLLLLLWFAYTRSQKAEYIFLMGDNRSYDDYPMYRSMEQVMEEEGSSFNILLPQEEDYSSIRQIEELTGAVGSETVCILVNAATNSNLSSILKDYREADIRIISCISEVDANCRDLHVGTVDPQAAAGQMMEEVQQLLEGDGMFAIVSGTPYAVANTSLVMELRYLYEEQNNPDIVLADIVYAYDNVEEGTQIVTSFLKNAQDLSVLLCITDQATEAACAAVKELGLQDQIRIIGTGTPQYLNDYLEDGTLQADLFYCDMEFFGTVVASLAQKVVSEEVQLQTEETFLVDGESFTLLLDEGTNTGDADGLTVYVFSTYEQYRTKNLSGLFETQD